MYEHHDEIEQLWNEHQAAVLRFIQRRCSDVELAEEVTAETFLQACQALDRGVDVGPGWLMTVARRRLVDHWRTSQRRAAILERLDRDEMVMDVDLPDDVLRTALSSLGHAQRQALVLRYCHDHSVKQVAESIDRSYRATESLLVRGRKQLATAYLEVVAV